MLCLLFGLAQPSHTATLTNPEVDALVRWFDQLGFPDLSRASLVDFGVIDSPLEKHNLLVAEDADGWQVILSNRSQVVRLSRRNFLLGKSGTPSDEAQRLRRIDPPVSFAWAFIIARACLVQGAEEDGRELVRALGEANDRRAPRRLLLETLADEFARAEYVAVVREYAHATKDEDSTVASLRRIVSRFPTFEPASALAATFERMREDAAKRPQSQPWTSLTPDEQLRDAVYRLRTASQQELNRVWDEKEKTRTPPAPIFYLRSRQYEAVPVLLDALDDNSPTHLLNETTAGNFQLVAVRDIAADIVSELAGKRGNKYSWGEYRDRKDLPDIEMAKAWCREHEPDAERAKLLARVNATGNANADQAARAFNELLWRFPSTPTDTVLSLIEKAGGLDFIAKSQRDDRLQLLARAAREGRRHEFRLSAAALLWREGEREQACAAVSELLKVWDFSAPEIGGPNSDLLSFLLQCESPELIKSGEELLEKVSAETRGMLLGNLGGLGIHGIGLELGSEERSNSSEEKANPGVDRAIETLLASRLDDQEGRGGSCGMGGFVFYDPCVGDYAAAAMAKRWPERYRFRWTLVPEEAKAARQSLRTAFQAARAGRAPSSRSSRAKNPKINFKIRKVLRPNDLPAALAKKLDALQGRPFEAATLVPVLTLASVAFDQPGGAFVLVAHHPGDESGFVLRFERSEASPRRLDGRTWIQTTNTHPFGGFPYAEIPADEARSAASYGRFISDFDFLRTAVKKGPVMGYFRAGLH